MTDFEIRAMNPADIDAAVDLALAQGWRDRRAFYALTLRTRSCQPLVGVLDGRVVATGLATVSAPVGWLGAVIVDEAVRGRGFGRAMTEELRRRLRAAGCETLALVATAAGQPLYERMGFRVVTHYRQMEGDHLDAAPEAPEGARLRPLTTDDLPRVFELDRLATAEDRRAVLAELASAGGWVLESAADATAGLAADAAAGHATRPEAGGAAGLAADAAGGLAADAAAGQATRPEAGARPGWRPELRPAPRPDWRPTPRAGWRPDTRPVRRPTPRAGWRPDTRPVRRPGCAAFCSRPTERMRQSSRPRSRTGSACWNYTATWHRPVVTRAPPSPKSMRPPGTNSRLAAGATPGSRRGCKRVPTFPGTRRGSGA